MNRKSSSKSESKFILIKGRSKEEEPIRWQWLTQRERRDRDSEEIQAIPRLSYSQKKNILTDLNSKERASSSNFKIREGFSRKEKPRIMSTATGSSHKAEAGGSGRGVQPFVYLNSSEQQLDIPKANPLFREELVRRIVVAEMAGRSSIAVLSAKRMGLRYKLSHHFVDYCRCEKSSHRHDLRELSQQIRQQNREFGKIEKELYYFHLDYSPLHHYDDILRNKTTILLVDHTPKLDFNHVLHFNIAKEIEKIKDIFQAANNLRERKDGGIQVEGQEQEGEYDWQRITNIKSYVDKISQEKVEGGNELLEWYNERYREEGPAKENDKNPLFESKSHFPNEIKDKRLLGMASDKVQGLDTTSNRHKLMPGRLDIMMEQLRREKLGQPSLASAGRVSNEPPLSKKDLLRQLERKNALLSTQNIPYLIEKYGLNRFEIYNLYNLYKSFEKIAMVREGRREGQAAILGRGVDRETFEVGLKGLDMNPGEELIRNICHFGDFISWEQFIKIISISLRKTPEEKLTAILKGISSFDSPSLSRHQISLMIGNSLHRLFDQDEPELQDYFTTMAMREFDEAGTGRVAVEVLKEKVLGKGSDNMNMVSFLILNT